MTNVTRECFSRPNGRVDEEHRLDVDTGIGGAPAADEKRMLPVANFCHRYGVGKTKAYAEMKAERLAYCQHGGKRLIHVDDAETWALSTRKPAMSFAHPAERGE